MEYHAPLVSCETLFENLADRRWVVFDCRHSLTDPQAGLKEYGKARIPGAYHAHVDRDMAGPVGTGEKGRHPLPIPGAFVRFLRTHGVCEDTQVVCYDDAGGAWAGRLWWLLRHYGHENVAVLDGGWSRWKSLGLATNADHVKAIEGTFDGKPGHMPTADVDDLLESGATLVDSRAPERFRGDEEPMDPVAGHIPGAVNMPFSGNMAEGVFLSPDELHARFEHLNGDTVFYCGSGVTAAHNVLAMEIAGLPTPALYPGSWSQWCHPSADRPVETG